MIMLSHTFSFQPLKDAIQPLDSTATLMFVEEDSMYEFIQKSLQRSFYPAEFLFQDPPEMEPFDLRSLSAADMQEMSIFSAESAEEKMADLIEKGLVYAFDRPGHKVYALTAYGIEVLNLVLLKIQFLIISMFSEFSADAIRLMGVAVNRAAFENLAPESSRCAGGWIAGPRKKMGGFYRPVSPRRVIPRPSKTFSAPALPLYLSSRALYSSALPSPFGAKPIWTWATWEYTAKSRTFSSASFSFALMAATLIRGLAVPTRFLPAESQRTFRSASFLTSLFFLSLFMDSSRIPESSSVSLRALWM